MTSNTITSTSTPSNNENPGSNEQQRRSCQQEQQQQQQQQQQQKEHENNDDDDDDDGMSRSRQLSVGAFCSSSSSSSEAAPAASAINADCCGTDRTEQEKQRQRRLRRRRNGTMMVLLVATARLVSAMARMSLGPLLPYLLQEEFGSKTSDDSSSSSSDSQIPMLLSGYSRGYLLTQILGGWMADTVGAISTLQMVLTASSVLIWKLTTSSSSSTGSSSSVLQQWTSLLFWLGVMNGPLYPAGSAALSLAVENTAQALAMVDAFAAMGTTLASLTPLVQTHWRLVFQTASTILLGMVFLMMGMNSTAEKGMMADANDEETEGMNDRGEGSTPSCSTAVTSCSAATATDESERHEEHESESSSSILNLLCAVCSPIALLTYLCHACDNFTKYSINAWTATLWLQYHAPTEHGVGMTAATIGGWLACQEAVGVLSRLLWTMNHTTKSSRKPSIHQRAMTSGFMFVLQGQALALAYYAKAPPYLAVMTLLISKFLGGGGHAIGYRPLYLEALSCHGIGAGTASGIGNTLASIASAMGPILIGQMQAQDVNQLLWGVNTVVGVTVLSGVVLLRWWQQQQQQQQHDDEEEGERNRHCHGRSHVPVAEDRTEVAVPMVPQEGTPTNATTITARDVGQKKEKVL